MNSEWNSTANWRTMTSNGVKYRHVEVSKKQLEGCSWHLSIIGEIPKPYDAFTFTDYSINIFIYTKYEEL